MLITPIALSQRRFMRSFGLEASARALSRRANLGHLITFTSEVQAPPPSLQHSFKPARTHVYSMSVADLAVLPAHSRPLTGAQSSCWTSPESIARSARS